MRHYCTHFDAHHLPRGLALHRSLAVQDGEFELTVLSLDEAAEIALRKNARARVRRLPLAELIAK